MCAGCRTWSRCTGPRRIESSGALRAYQTLWAPAGVERTKVPFFHCHLALVVTSGQQLGTESEE